MEKIKSKFHLRKIFKIIRNNKSIYLETNPVEKEIFEQNMQDNLFSLLDYIIKIRKIREVVISLYYPLPNEINCLNWIKTFHGQYKICLPKTCGTDLKFYEYNFDETNLVIGEFKLKEPKGDIHDNELIPNIILTPLLAFDKNKNRLGYGKGYYDRLFANYKHKKINYTSVGIAFDDIYYEDTLPIIETDIPLDYIITPSKII